MYVSLYSVLPPENLSAYLPNKGSLFTFTLLTNTRTSCTVKWMHYYFLLALKKILKKVKTRLPEESSHLH